MTMSQETYSLKAFGSARKKGKKGLTANAMRKLSCGRALSRLCLSPAVTTADTTSSSSSCFCFRNTSNNYSYNDEKKPLINDSSSSSSSSSSMKLKDVIAGPPTLAFQLKPKMVVMRVSMHCNGCARKVEKHISKLEGVSSYQVDLETKMVVVKGDIVPFEVLESVSKVQKAQFWDNNELIC